MKNLFPIYIDLSGKKCLVVGGGKVAERKIKNILGFSPLLTVIAPVVTKKISGLAETKKIKWLSRKFRKGDISDCFLVFAATNDETLNQDIADICGSKNIPANIAKPGSSGSFIVPAFIFEGGVSVAVSTSGQSPMLARLFKQQLHKEIGLYAKLLSVIRPFRARLLTANADSNYNKTLWDKFFTYPVLDLIEKGKIEKVKELAAKIFRGAEDDREVT